MARNMGSFDRALRAFAVAPLATAAALAVGAWSAGALVLLALAGLSLATSAVGFCPLYVPFGIDTRGRTPLASRP
jgi:hypothetical protein